MSRDIDEGSVSAAAAGGRTGAGEAVAGAGEEAADAHENDLVMPGFRFHPTEEELIEFYLRRKVEGRRFNVELITFLDLYRFDPWELPAMAVIGEKEWFFYVPRDRKYRNGDRPNRVTASGYWKATGADRMIRGENSWPIGLKKTLVFYSGKAPKGVRSSWIMNEYRLPPPATDTDLFYKLIFGWVHLLDGCRGQKSEISLCRVYKRSGIDDGHGQPSSSNVQASSARPGTSRAAAPTGRRQGSSPSSTTPLSPTQQPSFHLLGQGEPPPTIMEQAIVHDASQLQLPPPPPPPTIMEQAIVHDASQLQLPPPPPPPPPPPRPCTYASAMTSSAAAPAPTESAATLACTYSSLITMADASMCSSSTPVDELSRLVGHSQAYANHHPAAAGSHFLPLPSPLQPMPPQMGTLGVPPISPATVSDKLWDWNLVPDTTARDYSNSSFK